MKTCKEKTFLSYANSQMKCNFLLRESLSNKTLKAFYFITSLFITLLLFSPAIYFFILKGTITNTFYEENVGYRYFYSLRMAYGHEPVWIPQGQILNVLNVLIQYFLSFFFPVNQLLPRIEWFAKFNIFMPAIFVLLSTFHLFKVTPKKSALIATWVVCFFLFFSDNLPNGIMWLTMPDYYLWAIGLSILCTSFLSKIDNNEKLYKNNLSLYLGLLFTFSLGMKISFIFFPMTVFLAFVCKLNNLKEFIFYISKILFIVLLCILLIYWASLSFGNYKSYEEHFLLFKHFFSTQRTTFTETNVHHYDSLIPVVFTLSLSILGLILFRLDLILISLVGYLYVYFVSLRFYNYSMIEYHAFGFIMVYLFINKLMELEWAQNLKIKIDYIFYILSIVFLIIIFGFKFNSFKFKINEFLELSKDGFAFHNRLVELDKNIWVLTSSNKYRPLSVESALCKGGTNIIPPKWGDSIYISKLFPRFHCALVAHSLTDVQKKEVETSVIAFSYSNNEKLDQAIYRIESDFDISLKLHKCFTMPNKHAYPFAICGLNNNSIMT